MIEPESRPLCRNVELKARLSDFEGARRLAAQLTAGPPEVLRQVDTYFHCAHGRLKLREIVGRPSELIAYARADETAPRASRYRIVPVADTLALRALLTAALGTSVVVEKVREFSLYGNVRIHLDQVRGLGTFLEFEAVLTATDEVADGARQVRDLCRQFGLSPQDLVAASYSDLLRIASA